MSWAGLVAGAVEAVVTMPFEVAKTRQQLGGSGQGLRAAASSALDAGGGFRGLYAGLSMQVAQSAGKVGIRFGLYERLAKLAGADQRMKTASGFLAGATEAFVWITPCERIKVLRIKHTQMPMLGVLRAAVAGGPRGLWAGATPTVVRNGATVGFRFYVYDLILERYCGGSAMLGGACVGALSAVLNNPVDVVKSEMQAAQGTALYRGMLDCASNIIKTKGLSHLLGAGLPARVLKIGIGQGIIFHITATMSTK